MRIDDAGPGTWLLAALASGGLVAWVLALAGMGGRIAPLADDPGMLKPVPSLPAVRANRLGPIEQYSEIAARPLLVSDRLPKPFTLSGEGDAGDAAQAFDFILTSVLITPGLQMAILQPPDGSQSVRVKLGEAPESHPAWRLSALNARSAVFDGPGGQKNLDLRVFDGQGGQPPTALTNVGPSPVGSTDAQGRRDAATPSPTTVAGDAGGSAVTRPAVAPKPPSMPAPSPAPAPETGGTAQLTEQAQMEAIRQRIQARRAALREQQAQPKPPANSP